MPRLSTARAPRSGRIGSEPAADGRVVVLVTAGPAVRDLMLTTVRRRLAGCPHIRFPTLAAEIRRSGPMRDGVLALSRTQFRDCEGDGAFAAVWSDHGVRMGLPDAALAELHSGATLVLPGPASLAMDARRWTDRVAVVGIAPELDRVRQALTPKACFSRLVAPRLRQRIGGLAGRADTHVAVALGPDIGRSIAELTAAIVGGAE